MTQREPNPPHHVLVVDDDLFLRCFLARVLERAGYQVTTAEGGESALEHLGADPHGFHALLTDVEMPAMDGHELIRRARALRPDLPAVLMSGRWGPGPRVPGTGSVPFLAKPFTRLELLETLGAIADRPSPRMRVRRPAHPKPAHPKPEGPSLGRRAVERRAT